MPDIATDTQQPPQQQYTIQDAANHLLAQGQNPSEYDLTKVTDALNNPTKYPEVYGAAGGASGVGNQTLTSPTTSQAPGPLETAARVGARAVVPTMGAGLGWGAGAALAPETGGLSLLAPIAGSLIGSYLAGKGQEAGLKAIQGDAGYQQSLATQQAGEAANPKTALLSEMAPQLLLGRPGLGIDLANRLKGAVVGAGSDIASQALSTGTPWNLGEIAKTAGMGALFNRPNLLGNLTAFGGHPLLPAPQVIPAEVSHMSSNEELPITQSQPPAPLQGPQLPGGLISDPSRLLTSPRIEMPLTQPGAPVITDPSRLLTGSAIRLPAASPAAVNLTSPTAQATSPTTTPTQTTVPQRVIDAPKMQLEQLQQQLQQNQISGKPTSPLLEGVNPQMSNTRGMEAANKEVAASGLPQGEDEQGDPLYQRQSNSGLNGLLKDNPAFQAHTQQLADQMGVSVEHVNGLTDKNGNDVAGAAFVKDRLIKLNPEQAGLDTGLHELNHIFARDMLASSNPTDRALVNQGIILHGSEEAMIEHLGLTDVKSLQEEAIKEGKPAGWIQAAKDWVTNMWRNIKFKFGSASVEDIAKMLQQRRGEFYSDPNHPIETADTGELLQRQSKLTGNPVKDSLVGRNEPNTEADKDPIVVPHNPAGAEEGSAGHSNIKGLRPLLEKVRDEGNGYIADKLTKVFEQAPQHTGELNSLIPHTIGLNNKDAIEVSKIKQAEAVAREQGKIVDLSNYASNDNVKKALLESTNMLNVKQQKQIAADRPVEEGDGSIRDAGIVQKYWPQIERKGIATTMTEKPNSSEALALKNDFIQHRLNQGDTIEDATKLLRARIGAYKMQSEGGPGQTVFGSNRFPLGKTLPESWIEPDARKTLQQYNTRVGKDFAWRDNIESDPQAAKTMGYQNIISRDPNTKQFVRNSLQNAPGEPTTSKSVKAAYDYFKGTHTGEEQVANAFGRVATSLFLGPATAIHIAISTPLKIMGLAAPGDIPALMKSMFNVKQGIEHALMNGVARRDVASVGSDFMEINSSAADKLNQLAAVITKITGRQHLFLFSQGQAQAMGETLSHIKIMQARQGDANATAFLQKLDPSFNPKQQFTPDQLSKLGSNIVNLAHGSYDPRSMPEWMLREGFVAPFFKLASWNISQTNHFMKYVYSPAKEYVTSGGKTGDFTPLVMSALGGVLGGAMIKALREKFTDREGPIPTVSELLGSHAPAEDKIPIGAYQVMAAASYAGFAGILSSIGKSAFDIAYRNKPQGAIFPLDEVLSSGTEIGSNYFSAMLNGNGSRIDMTTHALLDFLKQNVQASRVALNWIGDTGLNSQLANKYKQTTANRNYRAYQEVSGLPYQKQEEDESNPYYDIGAKLFKQERNPAKAMQELPDLIHSIFNRYQGQGPEVLRNRLEALKSNNYRTMPNPETEPLSSMKYINFVRATQGTAAANNLLQDYFKQNLVNKVKASMVPTL